MTSTTPPGGTKPNKKIESPYSLAELGAALDSLVEVVEGSSQRDDHDRQRERDAHHLFGYGSDGRLLDAHDLSTLQIITATRILDYKNGVVTDGADSEGKNAASSTASAPKIDYADEPRLDLRAVVRQQSPRMALAAEFKRASPSKGAIALHLKAGEQAVKYTEAGADVVSVLTETRWFQGSLDDLREVRTATAEAAQRLGLPQRPAVLRKDFVVNRTMIDEAAAAGADSVLLIVAVLPARLLKDLIGYSRSLGMEPLVEVHADAELLVAVDAGAHVVGVNNRNLHTFQLDLDTTNRIADLIHYQGLEFHHTTAPNAKYALCALSGMSTAFQVDRYRQVGVGMCLIGESLMRASDPGAAIEGLCLRPDDFASFLSSSRSSLRDEMGRQQSSGGGGGGAYTHGTRIIKVCGITNAVDAVVACRSGADLIGVIFAAKSKRRVSPEQAKEVVDVVRAFGERSARIEWKFGGETAAAAAPPIGGDALSHLVLAAAALVEGTRRPAVVGVFQNQEPEFVRQMVRECGLDLVQLHGSEGMAAASVEACGVPAIRVVDIAVDPETGKASETAVETILESITNDPIAVLLDTSIKGQKDGTGGGTGVAFDWTIAQRVQDAGLPVIVAGGLTPDSVKDCVASIRPFGVDVSSGVEAEPGRKDHDRVRAFVHGAREAAVKASQGF